MSPESRAHYPPSPYDGDTSPAALGRRPAKASTTEWRAPGLEFLHGRRRRPLRTSGPPGCEIGLSQEGAGLLV